MGRAVVTKGQRRLGRTIRKLEDSVELSTKESCAKAEEVKYREKAHSSSSFSENYPVENLRESFRRRKNINSS